MQHVCDFTQRNTLNLVFTFSLSLAAKEGIRYH